MSKEPTEDNTKQVAVTTKIRVSGYENIYFDCPRCGKENIINRITDIKSDMPVAHLEGLTCRNNKCKQKISLVGDTVVSAKYLWFMHELFVYVARKEYRAYILSLCQGIEAFFYQAIINKKYDRNPVFRDKAGRIKIDKYNAEVMHYAREVKTYAFEKMRTEFIGAYQDEIENYIPHKRRLKEDKRRVAFSTIERTTIHVIRNKVAHKQAYRPTWKELESFDGLVESVYWLGAYLGVEDSVSAVNSTIIMQKSPSK